MTLTRRHLYAFIVVVALLFVAQPAHAATEAELKAQLEALKKQTSAAGDAYSKAHWALDESQVRLTRIDKRMAKTNRRLKAARQRLSARASSMYRREGLDFVGFLVGASDFPSLVNRFEYLSRIGRADAEAVADVRALRAELKTQRSDLAAESKIHAGEANRLRGRRDKLQKQLTSKEAEFKRVKDALDRVRSGGSSRPSGVAARPGPNGMVFPVVGSYYYANTWGASRSGGRRRHQGTDIMARRGTRCVAILSGTVQTRSNGLGGKTIWLTADNGWRFYYAHLDTYIVTSGRVQAGQVIATVGSTGNASASSPHLHFQVHPNGGAPVNPYPYLRAME